jgi:hypothetical protein
MTEYDGWTSKSTTTDHSVNVHVSHAALFGRVEASISFGFASVQRALVDLQLQLQIKLRQLRERHEFILEGYPSGACPAEFADNVKKIDRALESFTAHADNLSHIKLTLARVAAFVSPQGSLFNLVLPAKSSNLTPEMQHDVNVMFGTQPKPAITRSKLDVLEERFERANLRQTKFQEMFEAQNPLDSIQISPSQNRTPNSTCFVFYLPPSICSEKLKMLFMRFGTVLNAYVALDKFTNRTRGFGFVDFSTPAEAQAAVQAMDKYPLEGKFLSVSIKV